MSKHLIILVFLFSTVMVHGQSSVQTTAKELPDQTAVIQELLTRIDKMEKRIAELEAKGSSSTQLEPTQSGPVVI